jgi:hypothetical protein
VSEDSAGQETPVPAHTEGDDQASLAGLLEQAGKHRDNDAKRIAKKAKKRGIEVMTSDELATEGMRHDLKLRKRVATFALWAVAIQLVAADVAFFTYAWVGEHWKLPVAAIDVWLGATVVQIIGILYVITNYLFPKSGTRLGHDDGDE